MADRCLPLGAEPVHPHSQRVVLEPVALAVVRTNAEQQSAVPTTVTFGGPETQSEALLVRFAPPTPEMDVDAAFLLLEPALDAEPTAVDVEIGVSMVSGGWRSGVLHEAPSNHGPTSRGLGRTRPPTLLRVDVTAQVRELGKRPRSDEGLLIRALGPSPRGAIYSTGLDGIAPRLDIYFMPRRLAR